MHNSVFVKAALWRRKLQKSAESHIQMPSSKRRIPIGTEKLIVHRARKAFLRLRVSVYVSIICRRTFLYIKNNNFGHSSLFMFVHRPKINFKMETLFLEFREVHNVLSIPSHTSSVMRYFFGSLTLLNTKLLSKWGRQRIDF